MTAIEKTNIRPLNLSQWIRDNLPDSDTGTRVTDIDFVICNSNNPYKLCFVEVKTHNAKIKPWQLKVYKNILDTLGAAGMDVELIEITFERMYFNDGRVYLNGNVSTETEIRERLSEFC